MKRIQSLDDKRKAFNVLTNAFKNSKGMTWMLRKPQSLRSRKHILNFFYSEALARDGAFITSDQNGVIFLHPQSKETFSFRRLSQKLYIFLFITGIRNGIRSIQYQKLIRKVRPKSGWVATLLACDSTESGIKTAFEIKQEIFELADRYNQFIYAETTSFRACQLYKIIGYELYHTEKHPYADLTIWFFRRNPKPYKQSSSLNQKNIA